MQFIDLKPQYHALRETIGERMQRVLDHGQFILGPEVAELERELAAFTGSTYCVTVASGTEAMLMALMAAGVGSGDEVIVPAFTFAATAEVVVLAGASPVFADVDRETGLLTAATMAPCIGARTKAVIPVSLYGQCCDMTALGSLAEQHGLLVIEDAAQSFGATFNGVRSCNLSAVGCTSFFPSKPLGCYGDGGAVFTNDAQLAQALREIRVHGQSTRYWHTRIGVGGRMDTLQCAVTLAKLERFSWELDRRAEIGARYDGLLPANARAMARQVGSSHVHAQYTVRVPDREQVMARMHSGGVPTAVRYPVPLSAQPAYAVYAAPGGTTASEQLAKEVLSLPMSPDLTELDQDRVIKALAAALN